MASTHQFGGNWTDDKLDRLRKYLAAYTTIFKTNSRAAFLRTTFVDAFAGTGYRNLPKDNKPETIPLFLEDTPIYDEEAQSFQKGSAQIALETDPPFHRYLFIEKNREYIKDLETLRDRFPAISGRVEIRQGEANSILQEWCRSVNWRTNRAVVFLDPYGMEVEWSTIETIARTKAIDLWLLFPLGQAVNRVLTKERPPEGAWANRLTRFFGTPEWRHAFYRQSTQMTLFGDEERIRKEADFEQIGRFFLDRLEEVFTRVADNPLYLCNRRNVPIYLLCFAAGNERGAPVAVKIAKDILGK
jgi:three-Cys-motif partner protein